MDQFSFKEPGHFRRLLFFLNLTTVILSQTALLIQEQTDVCAVKTVKCQQQSWAFTSLYFITPSFLELSPPLLGRERNNLPETGILTIIGGLSWIRGRAFVLATLLYYRLRYSLQQKMRLEFLWQMLCRSLSCVTLGRPALLLIAETKDSGLILQLKLQGPPGRTSESAGGLLWQGAGCPRRRGSLLTRKKVAARGDGRRWDGVPEGVGVVVTFWQPRAHVCNLQNSLRWFFFFFPESLTSQWHLRDFISQSYHCLSCFLHLSISLFSFFSLLCAFPRSCFPILLFWIIESI